MDKRSELFIERMGQLYQISGMPRIAGRMFALLMLSDAPRSMDDIVEQLQVSKASVSANARLLDNAGVIERVTKPGDRRDYYAIGPDPGARILEMRLQWLQRLHVVLKEGLVTEAAREAVIYERLESFSRFLETMVAETRGLLEEWRAVPGGREVV